MLRASLIFAVLSALLVAGCGDDDGDGDIMVMTDLGTDSGTGEVDMGPPPDSELFGECILDSQCQATMGPSAFCRTGAEGWPKGHCTLPCADRGPCDDGRLFHHCVDLFDGGQTVCEEACQNSTDCRPSYVCVAKGQIEPSRPDFGVCVGYCQTDEDCGFESDCNPYAAQCLPEGEVPTVGGRTGDPCESEDACLSGICQPEISSGTATGWNGGMCLANCALEPGWNSNDLYFGDALPTDACPDGNVCYPTGDLAAGSPGVCIQVCDSDADCRVSDGYGCDKNGLSGKVFTNGVCFPIDCLDPASPCPSGFSCETRTRSNGSQYGVCARN